MKPKRKSRSAAVLTIHDAANMTIKGRSDIVAWLYRQIYAVEFNHKKLAKRYTARYLY